MQPWVIGDSGGSRVAGSRAVGADCLAFAKMMPSTIAFNSRLVIDWTQISQAATQQRCGPVLP